MRIVELAPSSADDAFPNGFDVPRNVKSFSDIYYKKRWEADYICGQATMTHGTYGAFLWRHYKKIIEKHMPGAVIGGEPTFVMFDGFLNDGTGDFSMPVFAIRHAANDYLYVLPTSLQMIEEIAKLPAGFDWSQFKIRGPNCAVFELNTIAVMDEIDGEMFHGVFPVQSPSSL